MAEQPVVAVLGAGIMGAPMARNLVEAGMPVRVWNRTKQKLAPLTEAGAQPADSPADAAAGADIVLTMLADGPAVRAAVTGPAGALSTMDSGAVWAQCSTVGIQHTTELADLAREHGVSYVDAPVLGTKQPAEQGKLVVLESGEASACERCVPVFGAVGARTMHVGEQPGEGSKLKLVTNNWVLALVGATAETVALAQSLDVDPRQFLDAISGGALDVPYAHVKGGAILDGDYTPSFPASLAAKDVRLVLEAAGQLRLGGTRAVLEHLEGAEGKGHGSDDMIALYHDLTG